MSVSRFTEPSGHIFGVSEVYTATSFVCKRLLTLFSSLSSLRTLSTPPGSVAKDIPSTSLGRFGWPRTWRSILDQKFHATLSLVSLSSLKLHCREFRMQCTIYMTGAFSINSNRSISSCNSEENCHRGLVRSYIPSFVFVCSGSDQQSSSRLQNPLVAELPSWMAKGAYFFIPFMQAALFQHEAALLFVILACDILLYAVLSYFALWVLSVKRKTSYSDRLPPPPLDLCFPPRT